MNPRNLLLTIFVLITMTGCMAKKNLSPDDKNRISTVSINDQIIVTEDMWYTGPEAAFGIIGLLIEKNTINTEDKIKELASRNGINIGTIVKDEIRKKLSYHNHFSIVEDGASDSSLKITVKIYGLHAAPFSNNLNPILMVEASLLDQEGKVVWQSTSHQNRGEGTITLDEIFQNPEVLRNTWNAAASKAADEIVSTL